MTRRVQLIAVVLMAGAFAVVMACAMGQPVAVASAGNLDEAGELFAAGKWKQAAKAYEKLVQQDPSDAAAWSRLGAARHAQGEYAQAAQAYEEAAALKYRLFFTWYNLACSHARAGDAERAFAALDRALDAGFSSVDHLETDADLESLRHDPRYAALVEKVTRLAHPCRYDANFRAFDFWVGEWEVHNAEGDRAGSSTVELILDACVVLENWTSRIGSAGKSFNTWDRTAKRWQQTWVSDRAVVTVYYGGIVGGAMQLTTEPILEDGAMARQRMTFTALPDGRVRQHGQHSTDGGTSWSTRYDLYYTRKEQAQKQR